MIQTLNVNDYFWEGLGKCCYTNQSRVEDGEVAQPRENKTLQDLGAHSFGINKADIGSLKGRLEVAKVFVVIVNYI